MLDIMAHRVSLGPLKLRHKPESMHGIDLGPYTYVTVVQLGFYVVPPTAGAGIVSDCVTCLWILFSYHGI